MPDVPASPDSAELPTQDSLNEQVASAPAGTSVAPGMIRSPLVPGQRWRNYQIGDQIETEVGWFYHAVNVGMLEDVQIRVLPADNAADPRKQAWQELASVGKPGLLRVIEVVEEEGFRYEVTPPPPATSLRDWMATRRSNLEDIEHIVRQVGDILGTLHDRGLVHLNLKPEVIFLTNEGSVQHLLVSGLERATVYNQAGLIPIAVNPLYAPPEAAGLSKHSPGAGLRAWDWWSLGRILQELALGRHVLGVVLNRDITLASPDVRSRAEALLLERDPKAPRAGAVELMPPMSQRMTDLLRGLLTSSRDGRWGFDEVQRWLKQQPVKDRYQLSRNEQLFGWKDRRFTVAEAAAYFSQEAQWADGVKNLFDADDPTTLARFVTDRPEYSKVRERIDELKKFTQIPNWQELPSDAREAAITSAAWLFLGGEDTKLTLYGQRLDANCIKGLFGRGGVTGGVAMVKALTAKPFIEMIEQADPDTARLLSSLSATISGDAVEGAIKQGWLDLSNPADFARLVLLAMEHERALFDTRKSLQDRFACSREPHIQHLLTQPRLTHTELVLLAMTAAQPERYNYVTHENYRKERHELLRQRADRLARGLFWLRLGQATRLGFPLFGPWPYVLVGWGAVGAVAGFQRGQGNVVFYILAFGCGFAALRFLAGKWLGRRIAAHAPGVAAWKFNTPIGRSQTEAVSVLSNTGIAASSKALKAELTAIYREADALALTPAPAPLPKAGFVIPGWVCAIIAWAVLFAPFARILNEGAAPVAVSAPVDPETAALTEIEKSMAPAKPGAERTAEDVFYDNPVHPRMRWDYTRPEAAPDVPLASVKPATPDDVAHALIDGQRLLLPYQQATVDSVIAVPLKVDNSSAIMLYDGRNRRILSRQVLLPSQMPGEKSWFELGKLKVYYAGTPPPAPPPPPKREFDPFKPGDTSDLPEREVRRGAYQETPMPAEQKATNAQPLSEALDTMTP